MSSFSEGRGAPSQRLPETCPHLTPELRVITATIQKIEIHRPGEATIQVYLEEVGQKSGGIIVECGGGTWNHYWNAMASPLKKWIAEGITPDYLARKLDPQHYEYSLDIATAIIEGFRRLASIEERTILSGDEAWEFFKKVLESPEFEDSLIIAESERDEYFSELLEELDSLSLTQAQVSDFARRIGCEVPTKEAKHDN